MREKGFLSQRQNWQRNGEEDSEDLERDQLGEGLIDIASIAKLHSEVLDRNPQAHACGNDILVTIERQTCLDSMDLTWDH